MKRKFIVITAGTEINQTSYVLHVFAGESQRETKLLADVHDVCAERGWFISLFNNDCQEFLERVFESMNWTLADITAHTQVMDCRKFLDTYTKFDASPAPNLNLLQRKMLEKIDPNFYCFRQISKLP